MRKLLICPADNLSLQRLRNNPTNEFDIFVPEADEFRDTMNYGCLDFKLMSQVINEEDFIGKYELFCFIAEDITARTTDLNKLFGIMENCGIQVLLPAIQKFDNSVDFMSPQADTEFRFTNWAEPGCLLMCRDYLMKVIALLDKNYNSSATMSMFHKMTGIPFCIVDSVPLQQIRTDEPVTRNSNPVIDYLYETKAQVTEGFEKIVYSYKLKNIISFVVIFRQEDCGFLREMLDSLPPGSETVLVETIQSDTLRGLSGLRANGSRIYAEYYYRDFNYSEARNAAKSLATQPVIFSIDADERLLQHQHNDILRAALELNRSDFAGLQVRNVSVIPIVENNGIFSSSMTEQVRMFKNIHSLVWKGTVHETIDQSIIEQGKEYADSNIIIHHTGYEGSVDMMLAKAESRLKMLVRGQEALTEQHYFDYIIREANNYRTFQKIKGGSHGA